MLSILHWLGIVLLEKNELFLHRWRNVGCVVCILGSATLSELLIWVESLRFPVCSILLL